MCFVLKNVIQGSKKLRTIAATFRQLSTTPSLEKKYKYALDKKRQKTGGGRNVVRSLGPRLIDGKAIQYFSFDKPSSDFNDHYTDISPKQQAYSEIVRAAVESFLASKDAPQELKDCMIEVTQIVVSPSLTSARVLWRLPEYSEHNFSKEAVSSIFQRNLNFIRTFLPAYSTVTQTPIVSFTYDCAEETQRDFEQTLKVDLK